MIDTNISIDVTKASNYLDASSAELKTVSRLVTNKYLTMLNKELGIQHPKSHSTSVSGFRRVRLKKKALVLKKKRNSGSLWTGGNDIKARYGGRMRNVSGGAFAGRHFFKDAFVTAVRGGSYTSIWKRSSANKLIEQKFTLPTFLSVNTKAVDKVGGLIPNILHDAVEHQLDLTAKRYL